MPRMPGEFLDHVCTDPGERHCATSVVNENIVVRRSSRNLPGPIGRSPVFGDHLGRGLFGRDSRLRAAVTIPRCRSSGLDSSREHMVIGDAE